MLHTNDLSPVLPAILRSLLNADKGIVHVVSPYYSGLASEFIRQGFRGCFEGTPNDLSAPCVRKSVPFSWGSFLLLEIELWKIDDSSPAPKFNVVERPNDWAKEIKASEGMSETKQLQLHFWKAFNAYAFMQEDFRRLFSQRKAQPQHWYDLGVKKAHSYIQLSVNTQKKMIVASIYVNYDKELYNKYLERRDYIESKVRSNIEFSLGKKDGRIIISSTGDMKKNQDEWNGYFQWLCALGFAQRKESRAMIFKRAEAGIRGPIF